MTTVKVLLSLCITVSTVTIFADNSRLVAHRGDSSRYPQNTIAAIKSAVEPGAGMIEIDVWKCKTGELVVYGERDLEEVTDGTGRVEQASFDYLRSLSVYAPKKFGDKFKGKFGIPTFEEALAAIPEGDIYINCDVRNSPVDVAKAIKKAGRLKQAFLAMGTYRIRAVRAAVPEIMICNMSRPASPRKKWTHEEHMDYARATVSNGCQFVQYIGVSNAPPADVVGYCHDNGVKVSYGKSDFPKERERLFSENGIDFIFTDRLPAQKEGSNLVPNGGFDEIRNGQAFGWKAVNGFVFSRSGGRDGFGCAMVTNHVVKKPSYIERDFPIKGGRSYRVSAWIRSEGIKGSKNGAMPYAEAKDAAGKYIHGVGIYPRGAVGTSDWKRYSGVLHAPFDAVTISLGAMLFPNTEGCAWVDDIECVMLPEEPVKGVVADAYRNQTDRDSVRLTALLSLGSAASGSRGVFTLTDSSGRKSASFPAVVVDNTTAVADAGIKGLSPGGYLVKFELLDAKGRILGKAECPLEVVAKLPVRKVHIDGHQRTIVDGRPFFPLGMYSYNIDEEDIRLYVEAPFNCIMSYRIPTDAQMDVFSKYRIKAIVGFSNNFFGLSKRLKSLDEEIDILTNSVNRLKSHPATLAWYLHDEVPINFLPRIIERRRIVHTLDPEHPTWGVLCQPYNMEREIDTFDICGNDPYPVYSDKKKDMSRSWLWARLAKSQSRGSRCIWQVPQAFTWANYQKLAEEKGACRLPTFDEMRKMAYQQIAGGANGLIFYSFHDVLRTRKEEPEKWQAYWDGVKRLAAEIAGYKDLWLSAKAGALAIAEPSDMKISVRTWKKDGADYVLVSSGEDKEVALNLTLPEVRKSAKSLIGGSVEMRSAKSVGVSLDPYGFSLFRLTASR